MSKQLPAVSALPKSKQAPVPLPSPLANQHKTLIKKRLGEPNEAPICIVHAALKNQSRTPRVRLQPRRRRVQTRGAAASEWLSVLICRRRESDSPLRYADSVKKGRGSEGRWKKTTTMTTTTTTTSSERLLREAA